MPIPIRIDPDAVYPYKRCCFCRERTTSLTQLLDRTPDKQVPCCPECATCYKSEAVPTREDWCAFWRDALQVGLDPPTLNPSAYPYHEEGKEKPLSLHSFPPPIKKRKR